MFIRFRAYYATTKKRDRVQIPYNRTQMASANTNELYKKHPLRRETILARIRKQRKSLEGIDAFGKHCGTAASCRRNKFQDRDQEIARYRRDDAFGRFAHLDYNCGARLQAIKSGKRCKAKIEVWGKFDGDKAAGASVDLAKGEGLTCHANRPQPLC